MPRKIDPVTKERYLRLRRNGLSQVQAASETGISVPTAHRFDQMLRTSEGSLRAVLSAEHNPPRSFDHLPDVGKRALEDFVLFGETFFCLRIPAWWRIAARELVDAVQSPDETFTLLNAPTGAGKTTLLETLVMWLISGGGTCDTEAGRAMRVLFGSATLDKAIRSVDRIRRIVEDPRPYYDFRQKRQADHSLLEVFGRYKPSGSEGDDESVWRRSQFTIAQVGERMLGHKDPTVSAYSVGPQNASPLSARVDVAVVDDPAMMATVGDESLVERFEAEFESRLEPGGSLFAVGQRLHAADLYGALKARTWTDDLGEEHPVYRALSFPAHIDHEGTEHVEWNGENGCLLDSVRLPYRRLQREMAKDSYLPMYQQDVETTSVHGIVEAPWINGGLDSAGLEAIGCLDRERAFWDPVSRVDGTTETPLVYYVAIDPAEGSKDPGASWWALEVWGVDPTSRMRFLVYGTRGRWTFSEVLRFGARDEHGGFSGVLEDIAFRAVEAGIRLSALVIEQNKARGFLASSDFQRWHRERWPDLKVIPFQTTGQNKNDAVTGVKALLANDYRDGRARWPWKSGGSMDALDYLRVKMHELTSLKPRTTDTVMSEWVGAASLEQIIVAGAHEPYAQPDLTGVPAYLRRQQRTEWSNDDEPDVITPEMELERSQYKNLEPLPPDHPALTSPSYLQPGRKESWPHIDRERWS